MVFCRQSKTMSYLIVALVDKTVLFSSSLTRRHLRATLVDLSSAGIVAKLSKRVMMTRCVE